MPRSTPLYPFVDTPDPEQLAAIQAPDGPVRVLAPAGSGKTRVLTNRILELLNRGADPRSILALAFNRQAAEELRLRLQAAEVPAGRTLRDPGITARTLHALGHEIVHRAWGFAFAETQCENADRIIIRVLREDPSVAPVLQSLSDLQSDGNALATAVQLLRREISRAKTDLLAVAEHQVELAGQPLPFARLFRRIEHDLRQARCYGSYDDMIYWGLQALKDDRFLRQELQDRFRHVLIDEFQDLSACQLAFAELLIQPHGSAFVVGDDDQMIYGWRGADVRHLLHFDERHPGTRTFVLGTNYRSTRAIVRHARRLIAHNQNRYAKETRPAAQATAGRLDLTISASPGTQARRAAAWMRQHRETARCSWSDFAVLTRRRADHYTMALILDSLGIPHTPVDVRELFTGDDNTTPDPSDTDGDNDATPGPHCPENDGVILATMHATKGRQFLYVVLYNLTGDGADNEDAVEEERRVHYVGLTRAIEEILVTAPPYPQTSRFVGEMLLAPDFDPSSTEERQTATRVWGDEVILLLPPQPPPSSDVGADMRRVALRISHSLWRKIRRMLRWLRKNGSREHSRGCPQATAIH